MFHYDQYGNLIQETTTAGVPIRTYVWLEYTPIAQIDRNGSTETITYLHVVHLNTPRWGTDSTGTVTWRWEGEPFGTTPPTGATIVNLRFPGQYFDAESGLHYNWNRYYDPKLGRYITSDPIGLAGGLNTYAYALNNSLRFVDPMGWAAFCKFIFEQRLQLISSGWKPISYRLTDNNNPITDGILDGVSSGMPGWYGRWMIPTYDFVSLYRWLREKFKVCYDECTGNEISREKVGQEWTNDWVEKFAGEPFDGAPVLVFSWASGSPNTFDRWGWDMNRRK